MNHGRNEPCPCGSGKKYKRCCQASTAAERPTETRYVSGVQINVVANALLAHLGQHFRDVSHEDLMAACLTSGVIIARSTRAVPEDVLYLVQKLLEAPLSRVDSLEALHSAFREKGARA